MKLLLQIQACSKTILDFGFWILDCRLLVKSAFWKSIGRQRSFNWYKVIVIGIAMTCNGFVLTSHPVLAHGNGHNSSHPSSGSRPLSPEEYAMELEAERSVNQGLEQLFDGNDQAALESFGQALGVIPTHETAHIYRGHLYRRLGNYEAAIESYTRALERNPTFAYLYNSRGAVREQTCDYEGALSDYTQAIKLYPEDGIGYNNRGALNLKLGNDQSAREDFNQAIKYNSGYAAAYANRAELRLQLQDRQGAMTDFNQAIELNPALAAVYIRRAALRTQLGDREGAASDLQTVERLERDRQSQQSTATGILIE
jgi:tetratricopeptide (TPR) repeat protein